MVPVNLDQTNWVCTLNTPIWANGIAPLSPVTGRRLYLVLVFKGKLGIRYELTCTRVKYPGKYPYPMLTYVRYGP